MSRISHKLARFRVPNFVVVVTGIIWTVLVIYFLLAMGKEILSYLIVILGVFLFSTFTLVSFYLIKNELPFGIYAALSIVSLLLIFQQINYEFLQNPRFHALMLFGVMLLLMLIAVFKLWDLLAEVT